MSKARAKTFPKPPQRLNSVSAKLLGKNSNKVCYEASVKAIYNTAPKIKDSLTPEQKKMLANLRKNLSSTYQPE
jgi:hypothetical protein